MQFYNIHQEQLAVPDVEGLRFDNGNLLLHGLQACCGGPWAGQRRGPA